MHRSSLLVIATIALAGAVSVVPCFAQNSDFNLDVHANSHVTAKDIGLPVYPGATPFKETDGDSSSGDLGFVLNSFHFKVQLARYVTTASAKQVLDYYRGPLAKYGEVLQCNHGKPVGSLTVTKSGLTCADHNGRDTDSNVSDSDDELRAGTPEHFRIVAMDGTKAGKTKFGLVALLLPKQDDGK